MQVDFEGAADLDRVYGGVDFGDRYPVIGECGAGPAARQLALRFGSRLHPIGLHQAAKKKTDGVYISVKQGGTMIEYEDEDPEIRRRFEENLRRIGTPMRMST